MPFDAAAPLEALTAAELADLAGDALLYIVLDPEGDALSRSVALSVLDAWLEITVGAGIVQTIVAGDGVTVDDTDPANPVVSAESSGGGGVVDVDHVRKTDANVTVSGTGWANFDTATDIVLDNVQAGDVALAALSFQYENQAEYACLDVATIVAGAVVNTFSTAGAESGTSQGVSAWFASTGVGGSALGGQVGYTLQAGDIASGSVTLRVRRRAIGAGSKVIAISTAKPFQFAAMALRPMALA